MAVSAFALSALDAQAAPNRGRAAPLPAQQLDASQLAVVVNDADPVSVAAGDYYLKARGIPREHLVHVRIPGSPTQLREAEFDALKSQINSHLNPNIEAVVFVWTAPYAVACNSITSAYTMGVDTNLCSKTCDATPANPYFDSPSARPFSSRGMRLSMLLPTESLAQSKALIDRGVKSDGKMPQGTAYFLTTSDQARNTRSPYFPKSQTLMWPPVTLANLKADSIEGKTDVLFYFTGAIRVPKLETLKFEPGAIADHLTSTGGDLKSNHQMSSLEWLAAGATASYGTVSEPCNHWQKFPNPAILLKHYLQGEPVIEAYWKSVAWPMQGVFIGEPMAAPFQR